MSQPQQVRKKLGPRSQELLISYGVSETTLQAIEDGDVDWDTYPSGPPGETFELLLTDAEGGTSPIWRLSAEQADELLNIWEFERRSQSRTDRPSTFSEGSYDDWTGIKPDSDWYDLVSSYRAAMESLAGICKPNIAAPYLYICRHTLELQLKAIIMLGQKVLRLDPDLPGHHDLQKLWTAAYPIAVAVNFKRLDDLLQVRSIVEHYHSADASSFNFRYPVSRANAPIVHKDWIHSFGLAGHSERMRVGTALLDAVIRKLRFRITFAALGGS